LPRQAGRAARTCAALAGLGERGPAGWNVVELSKTADGCRRVQDALGLAPLRDQKRIVEELRGHVCELLGSPHGNHVVQLAVVLLPPGAVDFVRSEILDTWDPVVLARHRYGCRVLERLIEHFPSCALAGAVGSILSNVEYLSGDRYGNYVVQHLLEHGTEGDRKQIGSAVRSSVARFASNIFACAVLDKALTYCHWGDQLEIVRRVLEQEPLLAKLASSPHSFATTQRLFQVAARASGPAARGAAGGGGLLELACQQLLKKPPLDAFKAGHQHGQSLLNQVLRGEDQGSAAAPAVGWGTSPK